MEHRESIMFVSVCVKRMQNSDSVIDAGGKALLRELHPSFTIACIESKCNRTHPQLIFSNNRWIDNT